jgi:hypothetical protein
MPFVYIVPLPDRASVKVLVTESILAGMQMQHLAGALTTCTKSIYTYEHLITLDYLHDWPHTCKLTIYNQQVYITRQITSLDWHSAASCFIEIHAVAFVWLTRTKMLVLCEQHSTG